MSTLLSSSAAGVQDETTNIQKSALIWEGQMFCSGSGVSSFPYQNSTSLEVLLIASHSSAVFCLITLKDFGSVIFSLLSVKETIPDWGQH